MSTIQYVVVDEGSFPDDTHFLDPQIIDEGTADWYLESLAQDAGLDYFENHDGWESSWPMEIELFVDEKSVGTFLVEMEQVPRFMARKKGEAV